MALKKVKETKTAKKKNFLYYEGVGRRKSASCRARLHIGTKAITAGGKTVTKGEIYVNGKPVKEYFTGDVNAVLYTKPFTITNSLDRFSVTAHVIGGGNKAQLGAFTLAVSKALLKVDDSYRSLLKPHGLLTTDSRVRERRKAGLAQSARKEKQSPKR